jgi:hypothetical protein
VHPLPIYTYAPHAKWCDRVLCREVDAEQFRLRGVDWVIVRPACAGLFDWGNGRVARLVACLEDRTRFRLIHERMAYEIAREYKANVEGFHAATDRLIPAYRSSYTCYFDRTEWMRLVRRFTPRCEYCGDRYEPAKGREWLTASGDRSSRWNVPIALRWCSETCKRRYMAVGELNHKTQKKEIRWLRQARTNLRSVRRLLRENKLHEVSPSQHEGSKQGTTLRTS